MLDPAIYLDHNASTPCDPRVVEAMTPYLTEVFANPSSRNHAPGREASVALEGARERVAAVLGARSPTEIIFTSGATEGNNLALVVSVNSLAPKRRHLVTQVTEHPSVLEPMRGLQRQGWDLTEIGVESDGRIRVENLEGVLKDDTAVVSLMLANNETGTLQPVAEAASAVAECGAFVHCDAAQAAGKIAVDVQSLGVDMLSVSGHKIYAPKGIGCLYLRRRRPPVVSAPLLLGGGHERGMRSGTPNVPGAVALAVALEIAVAEIEVESTRLERLRDRLEDTLTAELEGCSINGSKDNRLPGTTNVSFAGVDGNALLASLPDLALSSGSACTTTHPDASPVLRAMGVSPTLAKASLRIGLGRFTTEDEADRAADRIIDEVRRLRELKRGRR
jgi:cysteine desulfurase